MGTVHRAEQTQSVRRACRPAAVDAKSFKKGAFLEMLHVREAEAQPAEHPAEQAGGFAPSPPVSAPVRATRGDASTRLIVMKALEHDRTRRHETASTRLMAAPGVEPVLAAGPPGAYRMRKFVRGYRGKW